MPAATPGHAVAVQAGCQSKLRAHRCLPPLSCYLGLKQSQYLAHGPWRDISCLQALEAALLVARMLVDDEQVAPQARHNEAQIELADLQHVTCICCCVQSRHRMQAAKDNTRLPL